MPATVLIGTQWGDEGKGKITDLLADRMDMVVRYQGGNNAGHTITYGNEVLKLHLIPSGILYPHIVPVIGNGVVVNPEVLFYEIDELAKKNISSKKLKISGNAHLIMPYHLIFDEATEHKLGKSQIGTTHRGIGPAYADKASRIGIRVGDLLDIKIFRVKLEQALRQKNPILTKVYDLDSLDTDKIVDDYAGYAERLKEYVDDTSLLINKALDENKNILFEGAQGTLLDLDHGTYPFVTSSSPVAGGAAVGAGIGPLRINKVIGILKAYTTRVGAGPFPTEQQNEIGEILCEAGYEYGTTTGRKRRCGWLDGVLIKYAVRLNGLTGIALTKLDVLSRFEKIKICTGYEYEGKIYNDFPPHQTIFHKCNPVYEELEGWKTDITNIKKYDDLPSQTKNYIDRIQEIAAVPIEIISVGPERNQTVYNQTIDIRP